MQIFIPRFYYEHSNIVWIVIIILACITTIITIYMDMRRSAKAKNSMKSMLSITLMMNILILVSATMCLTCHLFDNPNVENANKENKPKHYIKKKVYETKIIEKISMPLLDSLSNQTPEDSINSDSTSLVSMTVADNIKRIVHNMMSSITYRNTYLHEKSSTRQFHTLTCDRLNLNYIRQ